MTYLTTKLILDCDSSNDNLIEIYKNNKGKNYIGNEELMPNNFYFAIDRNDWEVIKEFIDEKFKD